jgi:hypothetical protein
MNDLKIRCSAIGDIMTEPRLKSELLSKTAIKAGIEAYIIQVHKKHPKDLISDAIKKGLLVEEDAITVLSKLDKTIYAKNEERFSNPFIMGTPDIVTATEVIDIKSSWDIFTFYASRFDKLDAGYEWQLRGYMDLTGRQRARLSYILCDTPWQIVAQAQKRAWYDLGSPDEAPEDTMAGILISENAKYDLTTEQRVHQFTIEHDPDAMERVYERVALIRQELKHILN